MKTMLKALLDEKFFNSCLVHEDGKKNEENSFCMDCCFSLCFHCIPHHHSHRILQIRRYMYNDVLRLKDAQKIFDCSLIQWYRTNSERVVFLRPRQRNSFPIRGSRCSCVVCNQSIKSTFVYCSMVCKFSTFVASNDGERVYAYSFNNPGSSVVSDSVEESKMSSESSVEENSPISTTGDEINYESMTYMEGIYNPEQKMSTAVTNNGSTRKLHGRKCIPQRSPFF